MNNKIIKNDFFEQAVLKGKTQLLNKFTPSAVERTVGNDIFFEIPKDSDHFLINRRIEQLILSSIPVNSSCCGFVKGKSYLDFLKPHIKGYYFLRLDIKDFFHSIQLSDIKALLGDYFEDDKKSFKYSPLDIALMSLTHSVSSTHPAKDMRGKTILPIGFPSSPVISNILFRKVDITIQKFCEDKKITYSRYADDLLFSSTSSRFLHSEQFEKEISIFISMLTLRLKRKKRIAGENTISLNGYTIQNKKKSNVSFLRDYQQDPIGSIRLSNKKLKTLKKLAASLIKKHSAVSIMENLFGLSFQKFKRNHFPDKNFYRKYARDQLQNKLKGYRSYLISWVIFDDKHSCVASDFLLTARCLIDIYEKNIE
ncbi:reverse transcriptase family protein [Pseudoalteromonas byunsanensis]|uniref:RNA-directed DNA polymerase n=1 Tax=Pseudoalteromonas byunsanensis TaxID=327939 RepID=A0A1S1N5Q9_9GAMM|nr:reverse transcriptase family protein [Pseudoalteromonas byunsanensis]OHU94761.1 reverse transcriptase [Pseudoalteromonas byunsanensis]